jgi:ABC-type cobalamin/Fe3+-siderophores transport system ATPase subunit
MSLKTESIEFQNGVKFKPSPITVIVGANNCGKTRFLNEIHQFFIGNDNYDFRILKTIKALPGDFETIIKNLGITQIENGDNYTFTARGYFGAINQGAQKRLIDTLTSDMKQRDPLSGPLFRQSYGKACVAWIQTEDRLLAGKSSPFHPDGLGLLDTVYNSGSQLEQQVSELIYDVFDLELKLDFSDPGKLSLRVGNDFSKIPTDPRDAKPILQGYPFLEQQGDGLRSFATTLLMVLTTTRPFILIDEPEAFLHPPQSAALGRIIGEIANENQHIVLSTHSADFLRGIMSVRSDIHIIRLSRTEDNTTAHLLETESIENIIKTPILNSTSVLNSLFYKGTVIMEGDSDRTFYEKIARTYFPDDEIHYIHAHNKQTIHKLIPTNARAAVPHAVIVDFDILRQREDLKKIVQAAEDTSHLEEILECQKKIQDSINKQPATTLYKELVKAIEVRIQTELGFENLDEIKIDPDKIAEQRISDLKSFVTHAFDESDKWKTVKRLGMEGLEKVVKDEYDKLNEYCRQVGIFIVPCGSLESWLVPHGIPASSNTKGKWITKALVWLDENDPEEMPIREFIQEIHTYLLSTPKAKQND